MVIWQAKTSDVASDGRGRTDRLNLQHCLAAFLTPKDRLHFAICRSLAHLKALVNLIACRECFDISGFSSPLIFFFSTLTWLQRLDCDGRGVVPQSLPHLAELAVAELAQELQARPLDLPLVARQVREALRVRLANLEERKKEWLSSSMAIGKRSSSKGGLTD